MEGSGHPAGNRDKKVLVNGLVMSDFVLVPTLSNSGGRLPAGRKNAKRRRQATYLEAVALQPGVEVFHGHYLEKSAGRFNCGNTWSTYEEKMTDVNLATELLADAFTDAFDTALVISADSDLVPPVRTIRRHFPAKKVVVAMPPARTSAQLRQVAHASFVIGRGKLAASQLPPQVVKPDGHVLQRPAKWV